MQELRKADRGNDPQGGGVSPLLRGSSSQGGRVYTVGLFVGGSADWPGHEDLKKAFTLVYCWVALGAGGVFVASRDSLAVMMEADASGGHTRIDGFLREMGIPLDTLFHCPPSVPQFASARAEIADKADFGLVFQANGHHATERGARLLYDRGVPVYRETRWT